MCYWYDYAKWYVVIVNYFNILIDPLPIMIQNFRIIQFFSQSNFFILTQL